VRPKIRARHKQKWCQIRGGGRTKNLKGREVSKETMNREEKRKGSVGDEKMKQN